MAGQPDEDLDRVLAEIARRGDCHVLSPIGQAQVPVGVLVPDDLRRSYDRCGGVVLFADAPFTWQVNGPDRLVPASPRLLTPAIAARTAHEEPEDLTNSCHVIADGGRESATDQHVVVDLHPDRLGRCYDAFWDTYGLVGEMPVVALTIAELLEVLLASGGQVGALPGRYGDAYDDARQP